jgi:hypothetical protein
VVIPFPLPLYARRKQPLNLLDRSRAEELGSTVKAGCTEGDHWNSREGVRKWRPIWTTHFLWSAYTTKPVPQPTQFRSRDRMFLGHVDIRLQTTTSRSLNNHCRENIRTYTNISIQLQRSMITDIWSVACGNVIVSRGNGDSCMSYRTSSTHFMLHDSTCLHLNKYSVELGLHPVLINQIHSQCTINNNNNYVIVLRSYSGLVA